MCDIACSQQWFQKAEHKLIINKNVANNFEVVPSAVGSTWHVIKLRFVLVRDRPLVRRAGMFAHDND
jgi:hypothetical protein